MYKCNEQDTLHTPTDENLNKFGVPQPSTSQLKGEAVSALERGNSNKAVKRLEQLIPRFC